MENLAKTVRKSLAEIWSGLSKPDGLEDSTIDEFFDCKFVGLPHLLFFPDKFDEAVVDLRKRFVEPSHPDFIFNPSYKKNIPADGFSHFADSIWSKIMSNRDLDLPTQRQLLAQYRCDEISHGVFETFSEKVKPFKHPLELGKVVDGLGKNLDSIRSVALEAFDLEASRYHAEVYTRKRQEFLQKCNAALEVLFIEQIRNLYKKTLVGFQKCLEVRIILFPLFSLETFLTD